jgi:hypothetical protein
MNRASLALVLLLGTVAATLVAAGVARDLDRAGLRTSEPDVVNTDQVLQAIPHRTPWVVGEIVTCSLSFNRATPPSVIELSPLVGHHLPAEWKPWSRHLVAVPPIDLVPLRQPEKTCRFVDRRQLARLLAEHNPADTKRVDDLIRANDGIAEEADAATIPFGHVSVGGRLLRLDHRSTGGGAEFAWTGVLHYGADRRQTLRPIDAAAALGRQVVEPLPGETLRLWSDDCAAMIAATSAWSADMAEALGRGLLRTAKIVKLADWAGGQFDEALACVTRHLKREVWLAISPPSPKSAPVQSAQRPRTGTAKE